MSKRKKKPKKPLKKRHYFLHPLDRDLWGAPTLCKDKGTGTHVHAEVTCKACLSFTDYDEKQYELQCETPLVFCLHCEGGVKELKSSNPKKLKIGCTKCTHTEWKDRSTFGG